MAKPGPPKVVVKTRSSVSSESISRNITTSTVTGRSIGQITERKICQRLAPSTAAAFSTSPGSEVSAAA